MTGNILRFSPGAARVHGVCVRSGHSTTLTETSRKFPFSPSPSTVESGGRRGREKGGGRDERGGKERGEGGEGGERRGVGRREGKEGKDQGEMATGCNAKPLDRVVTRELPLGRKY